MLQKEKSSVRIGEEGVELRTRNRSLQTSTSTSATAVDVQQKYVDCPPCEMPPTMWHPKVLQHRWAGECPPFLSLEECCKRIANLRFKKHDFYLCKKTGRLLTGRSQWVNGFSTYSRVWDQIGFRRKQSNIKNLKFSVNDRNLPHSLPVEDLEGYRKT